jgi:hypothetical protein
MFLRTFAGKIFFNLPRENVQNQELLIAEVAKKGPQSLPRKSKQFNPTGFDRVGYGPRRFSSPMADLSGGCFSWQS